MTGAIRLTLPGAPVTRDVTWDMVRAYLRAEGWEETRGASEQAPNVRVWRIFGRGDPGDPHVYVGAFQEESDGERMALTIQWLARLASVSPGEMLARIADGATTNVWVHSRALALVAAEDMRDRAAKIADDDGAKPWAIACAIRVLKVSP